MKSRLIALSGLAVLLLLRARGRVIELKNDLGQQIDELDARRLKRQVKQLSKGARKVDAGHVRSQVEALAALAQNLNDKELRSQVKRIQKSVKDLDTGRLRDQAEQLSGRLQELGRARSRPRRRFPILLVLLVAGAIGAGLAASRRRDLLPRMTGLGDGVGRSLPGFGRQGGEQAQEIKAAVESAIHSSAPAIAPDIRVEVEGRTVYLRGATVDREQLETAVRSAQEIPAVAAVINLVSMSQPSQVGAGANAGGPPASS